MQENNFDKKIREQLERREINPSLNSWDKLNAQLDDKETKSTKKYWWLGIAASFLAGILLTSLVFNDSYVKVTPKVVNGNSSEEIKKVEQHDSRGSNTIMKDEKMEVESTQLTETKVQLKDNSSATQEEKEKENLIAENVKASPVKITEKKENEFQIKKEVLVSEELQLTEDIEKTVPLEVEDRQLATLETQALDAEVEQLLERAQEKAKLRNFENPYNLVNAEDLLEHIEVEDKQSFKEKVWLALENGFHQVKSTVIE
ncbi:MULTISPECIES: hypothetical protein [Mesonia]|uniref:Uncharacterized protein n=1 Tax=Mesonia oceanica TaxID=2687242 RepID=A0AC61Y880_9FLAO|nr:MULTISPECIES: hypothetical protein [Mesonia]MBJ97078.1 hypothetical protein [Flavobacteriaceae bacterium]VVV00570.1 hypothetical protein FVB9532_01842 [Mesonia oceanica]